MAFRPEPELAVDLDLPASYPSRYRARLIGLSRLEVRIRFSFEPRVFRTREIPCCAAGLSLTLDGQTVQLEGVLESESGGIEARIRFAAPVALPDYSLLRRAWALEQEKGAAAKRNGAILTDADVLELTAEDLEEAPLGPAAAGRSA